jgi:uncharacterized protein YxeA
MLTMKAKIIIFCFLMFFIALGLFAWQKEFINKSYLVVKEKKGYKNLISTVCGNLPKSIITTPTMAFF